MQGSDLSVIIPCHNEEKRIGDALEGLSAYLSRERLRGEIVVSEDGSTDQTVRIVQAFMESGRYDIPIQLLSSARRLGKGGGIRRGISSSTGRYVFFLDVDLPVPLENIQKALMLFKSGADIVVGSRLSKEYVRDEPFYRRIHSLGYHYLFKALFGLDHDTQCGFKALRRDVARELFEHITIQGFSYDVDLIVQGNRHGYKIVDLPVNYKFHPHTKVKIVRQTYRMFIDLLRVWIGTRK